MMKTLVRYDQSDETYNFIISNDRRRGELLAVGLHQDDLYGPLALLRAVDWLRKFEWFTLRHLTQLFDLTRLHAKWPVWHEQED
jgi:hypothetical protein